MRRCYFIDCWSFIADVVCLLDAFHLYFVRVQFFGVSVDFIFCCGGVLQLPCVLIVFIFLRVGCLGFLGFIFLWCYFYRYLSLGGYSSLVFSGGSFGWVFSGLRCVSSIGFFLLLVVLF